MHWLIVPSTSDIYPVLEIEITLNNTGAYKVIHECFWDFVRADRGYK